VSIRKAEMPTRQKRHSNLADIRKFVDSGWDCAEVNLDGRKPTTVYKSFRDCVRMRGITGVYVLKRGEHVYLIRDYSPDLIGEGA